MPSSERPVGAAELQRQLDDLLWYHSIDVAPGVATKGWFDLRHALPLLPWPDVRGKRCLDIGTWDGFYAYELERRGAAEVVAVDVPDLSEVDYPPEVRADSAFDHAQSSMQRRPAGFELLREVLDSKVQWRAGNIYDLDPDEIGRFDVVVLGSLLVHLRDPVRALDAVRRVTAGSLLSVDFVSPYVHAIARGRPLFELRGETSDFQWWLASDAGLRQLLKVGGFDVQRSSKFFLLRPGLGSPQGARRGVKALGRSVLQRVFAGDGTAGGHLHRAHLAVPRF